MWVGVTSFTTKGIARKCVPSVYITSILNLEESVRHGLAEQADGIQIKLSSQENPKKAQS